MKNNPFPTTFRGAWNVIASEDCTIAASRLDRRPIKKRFKPGEWTIEFLINGFFSETRPDGKRTSGKWAFDDLGILSITRFDKPDVAQKCVFEPNRHGASLHVSNNPFGVNRSFVIRQSHEILWLVRP
jgi:hypothetical protein